MENKTALQKFLIWFEEHRMDVLLNIDTAKDYAQSLLPLEKEEYRKCWEAGGEYYSDRVSNATDFPTWFSRYETDPKN